MAQTLSSLRLESQQRCNQESKNLIGSAEWNRYINEAISELYDAVLAVNPHYYVRSFPFTLSSVNTLDLTTLTGGFYKLRGVDYLPSANGRAITLHPFNFAERNRQGYRAYALEGSNLMILPNTNFAGNYTIWYTGIAPVLVGESDPLDMILDVWSEYITVTVAIAGATKEESPIDALSQQKALLMERVGKAAANRDGEPAQAADLTQGAAGDMLWWEC